MRTDQNPSPLQVAILLESLWLHDIQNIPFLPCWRITKRLSLQTHHNIHNVDMLESDVSLCNNLNKHFHLWIVLRFFWLSAWGKQQPHSNLLSHVIDNWFSYMKHRFVLQSNFELKVKVTSLKRVMIFPFLTSQMNAPLRDVAPAMQFRSPDKQR